MIENSMCSKGISADWLKWIALLTMFIDHIGAAVVGKSDLLLQPVGKIVYYILRYTGRLAFPIYCFLLIEGFRYTRNRMKYLGNLLLFAVLSEIPFELAVFGNMTFGFRNVYWTLAIGLTVLLLVEKSKEWKTEIQGICSIVIVMCGALLAELLNTDYSAVGVLLIFLLYMYRENRKQQCVMGAVIVAYEITAPIAFLLLYKYNGVRKQKNLKYFFYAFYPLHLLVLYWIRTIVV